MKTGWRHNDPQTQREFERFRRASTVTTETTEAASTTAGGTTTTTTGGGTTTIITNPPSSTYFELDAISPYQTCQVTIENTGTKAFLTIDRFLTVGVDGLDILTRLSPTLGTGITNTVKRINFVSGSNVVLNGSNFADDEVTVTINASVTGGGGGSMSSWYVRTNADASEQISDAETVTFNNGETTYWSRVGNTLTVERPLTIKDDGVAVGDDNVIAINYDSNSATGTSFIEWEVLDIGGGERRVRGKYNAGAGSYYWNIQANGGVTEQVNNTDTVNFTASGSLVVTRTGKTINYSYTQPAAYTWIASNGVLTATVTTGETVVWQGSNGVVVNFNTGTQTFTIDRALQIQDDSVNVGDAAAVLLNYDSNGATGTNYIEWEVADTGSGQRRIRGKYNPGAGGAYSWYLVATGTAGSEEITNTEQAIFTGRNGIAVTRVNNQIFIERSTIDPGGGSSTSKRTLTGEAIFSFTAPDYTGSQPPYRYGTRQYVDIVHNWNLSNLNNFHLELVDRALDSTGTNVVYYRSGLNTIWGGALGNQKFRNIPHWAAVDRNTIRVWATMSRQKPTEMRFRYTLVEL